MNYSTAIFLVNPAARAVAVSYEVDSLGKGVKPFTLYKTIDPAVKVGDYAIIPTDTRHKMTVVRVEEVDVEVDLDYPKQMEWLIAPVDTRAYEAVLKQEAAGIDRIKSAEKAARQKELRDKLMADNPDLAALANVGADVSPALPAPEQPPAPQPFTGEVDF